MKRINELYQVKERPVRVMQFGEGNFLRAFADYMIDIMNERGVFCGNVLLVKPIPVGSLQRFEEQKNVYTVALRGMVDGKPAQIERVVTSVAGTVDCYAEYDRYIRGAENPDLRFVISNTTEAGIVYSETDTLDMAPPASFPGKLTQFLYRRAEHFGYAEDKGLIMLPVELIDDNGIMLHKCVVKLARRWDLGERFLNWLENACVFTSTLVDRIVTGYPRGEEEALWEKWGYRDELAVTGEPFALWVIESAKDISAELPFEKAGLPVIFTKNQKPYKQRKVRILNGAHTSFVLASYLKGNDTVGQSMEDELMLSFIKKTVYEEVIPTLTLPKEDLRAFADAVMMRFRNPFVKHMLLSIALNSVSKWRARCMPSLLDSVKNEGRLPSCLAFSMAALIAFYTTPADGEIRDGALTGLRGNEEYAIRDDEAVLAFFASVRDLPAAEKAEKVLSNEQLWGQDLTQVPGFTAFTARQLESIGKNGIESTVRALLG
ncbi:MAG: altronate oxidoreductase [Clostridiales bacterium]|nr:altronate oxidoreductase [Clostridiales bacterium]